MTSLPSLGTRQLAAAAARPATQARPSRALIHADAAAGLPARHRLAGRRDLTSCPSALASGARKGHDRVMARTRDPRKSHRGSRQAWLPPRWFIVTFWHGHRLLLRLTHARWGLWRPKRDGWGTLRLT